MKRRLLNLLTALSLVLCVAVCVLWVRSYAALWAVQSGPYRIRSSLGAVTVDNINARWLARRTELQRLQAVEQCGNYAAQGYPSPPPLLARASAPPVPQLRLVSLRLPYVLLAVASVLAGTATATLSLRRRRQATTSGRCTRCGYDLRATPDRCPECGSGRYGGWVRAAIRFIDACVGDCPIAARGRCSSGGPSTAGPTSTT